MIKMQWDDNYMVESQSGNGKYWVHKYRKKWKCSCPDFEKRKMECKHIFAVIFSNTLKNYVEEDHEKEQKKIEIEEKGACANCGSDNVNLSGKRKTNRGKNQRFYCKDCSHRFVVDKGFSKMKHDPNSVMVTLDLYFKGVSYRKICYHLKQFHNIIVNPTTPMR